MGAPEGHLPYPGCETGGRPSIYTKEFIENEADELQKWIKDSKNIYFKDFALQRGYAARRINEFAEKNEKFAQVFELVKDWQESKLVRGGLTRQFESGFTRFVMARVCGWKEEKNVNITSNGNPLPDWVTNADGQSKDLVNESIKE